MPKTRRRAGRINIKNSNTALMCAFLLCACLLFFTAAFFGTVVSAGDGGQLKVEVVTDKQEVSVVLKGHIHKEADSFKAELFSDAKRGRCLYTAYEDKQIRFKGLNPGTLYHIKITECINTAYNYKEFSDTSILFRARPLVADAAVYGCDGDAALGAGPGAKADAAGGNDDRAAAFQNKANRAGDKVGDTVYKDKEQVRKVLENAALERKQEVAFDYPEEVQDFAFSDGSLLLDDELCSVAYTWYYLAGTNDYGERISILGKPMYRYDYRFDYNYSAARQKEYLDKTQRIVKKISGGSAQKKSGKDAARVIKRFNKYFTDNCVYDDTLTKGDPYDAIVGGVAVCDGYSKAAHFLLNMAGVPCEYVYGKGFGAGAWESHSWNITELGGRWYSSDFTWDSQLHNTSYLLKGTGNSLFSERHVLAKKFRSEQWKKTHPLSKDDYPDD